MDHNFWNTIWTILATAISAAFASYHGGKKGSGQ